MRLTDRFSASVGAAVVAALALAVLVARTGAWPAPAGARVVTLLLGLVLIATGAALVLDSRRRSAEEGSPVRVRKQRRA